MIVALLLFAYLICSLTYFLSLSLLGLEKNLLFNPQPMMTTTATMMRMRTKLKLIVIVIPIQLTMNRKMMRTWMKTRMGSMITKTSTMIRRVIPTIAAAVVAVTILIIMQSTRPVPIPNTCTTLLLSELFTFCVTGFNSEVALVLSNTAYNRLVHNRKLRLCRFTKLQNKN